MADVQRLLVPYLAKTTGFGKNPEIVGEVAEMIVNGQPPETDPYTPPRHAYHFRQPDILSTRNGMSRGEYLKLFVNPTSANWTMSKRGAYVKTAGGGVHNTWYNTHRKTYFDTFPLALEFRSGNIMPSAGHNVDLMDVERAHIARDSPRVPPGLDNFYKFMRLADSRSLTGNGPNYVILIYHSRVFPTIWLEGFFSDDSIQFTENADNANELRWMATLMVVRTSPKISNYGVMRAMYIDYIRNTNSREATPLAITERNENRNLEQYFGRENATTAKVARTKGPESQLKKFFATKTGFEENPEDFGSLP